MYEYYSKRVTLLKDLKVLKKFRAHCEATVEAVQSTTERKSE